jgi:sensor c-di-GMP phosphodiesterase-like protein
MLRMEQIAMQDELQAHRIQIADHSNRIDSMKPHLTASAITTILGAISHTAKLYRQAQAIKHVKVSVPESTEHFRLLLYDKYGVADIGYLTDIKAACKYLQAEAKRYQAVINEWYNRNNLFTGGAA